MRQAFKYLRRGAAGNRRLQIFRHSNRRPIVLSAVPDVGIDGNFSERGFPWMDIRLNVPDVASDAADKARFQYVADAGLKLKICGQCFIIAGDIGKQQAK